MAFLDKVLAGHSDWEGTAQDLSRLCAKLAAAIDIEEGFDTINERLIRYYFQMGVISRPRRRGKEAYFGFRQVVELLTARMLAKDGWPLAKIAEFIRSSDTQTLIGLLPGHDMGKQAQHLVRKFRAAPALPGFADSTSPVTAAIAEQTSDSMRAKWSIQKLRTMLGGKPIATRREMIRIELSSWCHLDVDIAELRRHPPEIAEIMGKALAHQLRIEGFGRKGK